MRLRRPLGPWLGQTFEFATIRELVTAIVVHASPSRPGGAGTNANAEDDRSVRIDIKGRLAALCGNPALFPNMAMSGGMLVARGRYRFPYTMQIRDISSDRPLGAHFQMNDNPSAVRTSLYSPTLSEPFPDPWCRGHS